MTFATNLIARFSRAFRRSAVEQPDPFDTRLQKLSLAKQRTAKHSQSVFKSRQQRLAV
jgi:hypothetical protein